MKVVIALQNESTQHLDENIRVCNINAAKIHIIHDYFRFLSNRFHVMYDYETIPVITATRMNNLKKLTEDLLNEHSIFYFNNSKYLYSKLAIS